MTELDNRIGYRINDLIESISYSIEEYERSLEDSRNKLNEDIWNAFCNFEKEMKETFMGETNAKS